MPYSLYVPILGLIVTTFLEEYGSTLNCIETTGCPDTTVWLWLFYQLFSAPLGLLVVWPNPNFTSPYPSVLHLVFFVRVSCFWGVKGSSVLAIQTALQTHADSKLNGERRCITCFIVNLSSGTWNVAPAVGNIETIQSGDLAFFSVCLCTWVWLFSLVLLSINSRCQSACTPATHPLIRLQQNNCNPALTRLSLV